jgi:hypothetical protein
MARSLSARTNDWCLNTVKLERSHDMYVSGCEKGNGNPPQGCTAAADQPSGGRIELLGRETRRRDRKKDLLFVTAACVSMACLEARLDLQALGALRRVDRVVRLHDSSPVRWIEATVDGTSLGLSVGWQESNDSLIRPPF